MEYLVFEGKSEQEAMQRMYQKGVESNNLDEMRVIRKMVEQQDSFFGLKREVRHKILVGIPDQPVDKPRQKERPSLSTATPQRPAPVESTRESQTLPAKSTTTPPQPRVATSHPSEIDSLKQSVQEILQQIHSFREDVIKQQVSEGLHEEKRYTGAAELAKQNLLWIERFLMEREFSTRLVQDILTDLQAKSQEMLQDRTYILDTIRRFLRIHIPSDSISIDPYPARTILFAGPTGVGKTSTLVKMAAHIAAMRQKSMRFISIDRYKVGAESQIQTYAEYLQAPFHPITKEEDFFHLLEEGSHSAYYTFIDTAGKGPRDTIAIKELAQWIEKSPTPMDTYLVVSATTKPADIALIVERYSALHFQHIIVTKLDETMHFGTVLSAAHESGKPVVFMTNGQEVPQDFELADIEHIIASVLK